LKTKGEPRFDRPVTDRSKAFFRVFQRPIRPNFSSFWSF
jgi:hypothetical protein